MVAGTLYIVAAPSGAGKTTLVKALVENMDRLQVSVSHTTRPRRSGEQQGVDYYFVDRDQFEGMAAEGAFLEYAQVFGHYYGTSEQWVREALAGGDDVILEIDWQGARQVRQRIDGTQSIFILPPSRRALEQRLRQRDQDSEAVIVRRMQEAVSEIRHYDEFDFLVVNDVFEQALQDLRAIIQARRLRREGQQHRLGGLIDDLLEGE